MKINRVVKENAKEMYILTFDEVNAQRGQMFYITDIVLDEYDDIFYTNEDEVYTEIVKSGAEIYYSYKDAKGALSMLEDAIEHDQNGASEEDIEEFGEDWIPPFYYAYRPEIVRLIEVDGEYFPDYIAEIYYPEYL